MKYNPCIWKFNKTRQWTPRRIANARRAVKREQESVALFPELARYQTVEDRIADIDSDEVKTVLKMRTHYAASWREARRKLAALPAISRAGVMRYWQDEQIHLPRDAAYLLGIIREVEMGKRSIWRDLRIRRQLQLMWQGKLPRSVAQAIRVWDWDYSKPKHRARCKPKT